MLPVLVWFDSFVVILTPSNWLVDNLLDTETLLLIFVLKDVVKNGLAHTVEVVFVDLVEHGVNEILNTLLLDGMEVSWNKLDDVGEPVLSDGCNDINLDFIFDILAITVVRHTASVHMRVTQVLVGHVSIILFFLVSGLNVLGANNIQLGAGIVDVLESHSSCVNIDVETFT